MQHRWDDTVTGRPKYSEKNLLQRHSVQTQFYIFLGTLSRISLMVIL